MWALGLVLLHAQYNLSVRSLAMQANRPLSTTRLPGARPPRCIPHASAKKGVGTFQFSHNTDALASLQPELTWFYTWSAAKNNVAGDGQVRWLQLPLALYQRWQ